VTPNNDVTNHKNELVAEDVKFKLTHEDEDDSENETAILPMSAGAPLAEWTSVWEIR
jgi:hypothetical protein